MRLFQSESIFNVKTDEWEDRYWIEGKIVDGDLYFFELERERHLEIEKLKEAITEQNDGCGCDGNCEECSLHEDDEEDQEDFCDCPECTILRYSQEIQEITGGCHGCIEECLTRFFIDIVEHILIENDDENNSRDRGRFN